MSGGIQENHENPKSEKSEPRPRFEPGASHIQVWIFTTTLICPVAMY
jgi:hypothetical protein